MRTKIKKLAASCGASLAMALAIVAAPASAQTSGWLPGPDAAADNTFDGYVDAPTSGATLSGGGSFAVAGWFVDRNAEGWAGADNVQVFLGTMGAGGRMIAQA